VPKIGENSDRCQSVTNSDEISGKIQTVALQVLHQSEKIRNFRESSEISRKNPRCGLLMRFIDDSIYVTTDKKSATR
jgi:hypothetical protein